MPSKTKPKNNKWIAFVKKYATDHNVSYQEAMKSEYVKELYKYQYVRCVMCNKKEDRDKMFSPRICINRPVSPDSLELLGTARAHKICKTCWFHKTYGFANEGTNHQCPGCAKGLPINIIKPKSPNAPPPEVIDLLDD